MSLIIDLAPGLEHLFFPRLCEGCCTPLMREEDTLCLSCLAALPRTGYYTTNDNEAALRFAGRIPYQQVTALSHFAPDSLLQHLLHRLKYDRKKGVGLFLGRQLGYELLKSNWIASVDVIIPVPLHPKKEAERTYNQSDLIAAGISEISGKDTNTKLLRRTRHTESQTKKSREERIANMKDAFIVNNVSALKGAHVLLTDDVLTTGATLEAAAAALLKVPGLTVSIATAGIADG